MNIEEKRKLLKEKKEALKGKGELFETGIAMAKQEKQLAEKLKFIDEIQAIHKTFDDLYTIIQETINNTDPTPTLVALNNSVVRFIATLEAGVNVNNQPEIKEIAVNNLKDIKIPDEVTIKNQVKDAATDAMLAKSSEQLVAKLDQTTKQLVKAIEKQAASVSQDPKGFIAVRRVVKEGNALVFDDSTNGGGVHGGSGGLLPFVDSNGTPQRAKVVSVNGVLTIAVVNPDGTTISGGGGGGGGASTIADGADVTQGAVADAAVSSDTTGTLSGKLRGLVKILADIWDSTNHLIHTNIARIGGTAISVNSGTKDNGTQRVVIATDQPSNTNALVVDDLAAAATGGAVPANAQYQGNIAKTSLPAAATDGNLTGGMSDKFGRSVNIIGTLRDLIGTTPTTISASTSETTIVGQAASVFNDIKAIIVSNTSASTNTRIDFRDTTGGSVLFSIQSNGGQPPVGVSLAGLIPQTGVNTNWTAQCAISTTDIRVYVIYEKNR